jgi:CelD/BcsL family acetyltransferase involved in cellulose biosynthesis
LHARLNAQHAGFVASLEALPPPDRLGPKWQALAARAPGSFFQGWTWTGCEIERRFAAARLLCVRRGDQAVALALVVADPKRGRLYINQTGDADEDTVFVERAGILIAAGEDPSQVLDAGFEALAADPMARRCGRWTIAGADAVHRAALARVRPLQTVVSRPNFVARLDRDPLAATSANFRSQARRAERRAAEAGPIMIEAGGDVAAQRARLAQLAALHQRRWTARGAPGAFASGSFRRFHDALLARAVPLGEAEIMTVRAGDRVLAHLYNFLWRGTVLNYQAGVDLDADPKAKPGLVAHLAAMRHYAARGWARYDFLAGEARYKRSLATEIDEQLWIDAHRRLSFGGVKAMLRRWAA